MLADAPAGGVPPPPVLPRALADATLRCVPGKMPESLLVSSNYDGMQEPPARPGSAADRANADVPDLALSDVALEDFARGKSLRHLCAQFKANCSIIPSSPEYDKFPNQVTYPTRCRSICLMNSTRRANSSFFFQSL